MKYQRIMVLPLGNTLETVGETVPKLSSTKWIDVHN